MAIINTVNDCDLNEDCKSLTLFETFNKAKLEIIMKHLDCFKPQMDKSSTERLENTEFSNPILAMEKYYTYSKQSEDNPDYAVVETRYTQKTPKGRLFANNARSLQNIPRAIRATIAEELYWDIDIVNCYPQILATICDQCLIPCDYLQMYIDDRDTVMGEIVSANPSFQKDEVKKAILSRINNGKKDWYAIKHKTLWMKEFDKEMFGILSQLPQLVPAIFKSMTENPRQTQKYNKNKNKKQNNDDQYNNVEGRTMSHMLSVYENKFLNIMLDYLKHVGKVSDNAVLCFDGIMVLKSAFSGLEDLQFHMKEMEALIKEKTGFCILLKQKDMKPMDLSVADGKPETGNLLLSSQEEIFLIPEEMVIEENYIQYFKTKIDVTEYVCVPLDTTGKEWKVFHFNGHYWKPVNIDYICNLMRSLFITLKKKITNKMESMIEILQSDITDSTDSDEQDNICGQAVKEWRKKIRQLTTAFGKCAGSHRSLKNLYRFWVMDMNSISPHEENPFDKEVFLLGFENGVYDLKTGVFRDGRKEDMISKTTGYDYETISPEDDRLVKFWSFFNTIMPVQEVGEYLLKIISTTLEKQTLENIIVLTGSGRNGKDTLITSLLPATLGTDMFYKANNCAITQKNKSGLDVNIACMDAKTCVVFSEPSSKDALNVGVLKDLSGSDVVSARGLYSMNMKTRIVATIFIIANKTPPLDAVDEAIAIRMKVIPFPSLFRTQEAIDQLPPDTPYVYPVNPEYKSKEFIQSMRMPFMTVLLQFYKKFLAEGRVLTNDPVEVKEASKTYLEESDLFTSWFMETFEDDRDEFTSLKDAYNAYKSGDYYENLTKKDKRMQNYKWFVKEITGNPTLKPLYREIYRFTDENGVRIFKRNIILGYKIRDECNPNIIIS